MQTIKFSTGDVHLGELFAVFKGPMAKKNGFLAQRDTSNPCRVKACDRPPGGGRWSDYLSLHTPVGGVHDSLGTAFQTHGAITAPWASRQGFSVVIPIFWRTTFREKSNTKKDTAWHFCNFQSMTPLKESKFHCYDCFWQLDNSERLTVSPRLPIDSVEPRFHLDMSESCGRRRKMRQKPLQLFRRRFCRISQGKGETPS